MSLQNRLDKLERQTGYDGECECECAKFENVRVILPDNGRGDAGDTEEDARCGVCGRERLTIRVVYADQVPQEKHKNFRRANKVGFAACSAQKEGRGCFRTEASAL